MKLGDLVVICPGFPDLGIVMGSWQHDMCWEDNEMRYSRIRVFFNNSVFSVPASQLEVISECG